MINGVALFVLEDELILACSSGKTDLKHIDELLALGVSPNCKDHEGNTPLMAASSVGNTRLVKYLIDRKAEVNSTNNHNETAIKLACGTKYKTTIHKPVIELLLKNGANPNIVPDDGESPLIKACRDRRGNPAKVVNLLLAAGAPRSDIMLLEIHR